MSYKFTPLRQSIEQRVLYIRGLQALQNMPAAEAPRTPAPLPPPRFPSHVLVGRNYGRGRFFLTVMPKAGKTSSGKAKRYAETWLDDGTPGLTGLRKPQHKVVEPVASDAEGGSQLIPEKVRRRRIVEMQLAATQHEIRRLKKLTRRQVRAEAADDAAWRGAQQRLSLLIRLERDLKAMLRGL